MKKIKDALKRMFHKNKEYRYEFTYRADEVIDRARAVNALSLEVAGNIAALNNLLVTSGDNLGDDAREQVDVAIEASARSIYAAQTAFAKIAALSSESRYMEQK